MLQSEKIIVEAPMSFTGSTKRLWRFARGPVGVVVVLALLPLVWAAILCWYLLFGIFLVPYRVMRRGERKRKLEAARHRELLIATSKKGKR